MFGIFKSSVEFSKLGHTLDKAFSDGMSLIVQVERSPNKEHSKELILNHSYYIQREILLRAACNNWSLDRKIICLKIRVGTITLAEAYQAIFSPLFVMSERIGCTEEVKEILGLSD